MEEGLRDSLDSGVLAGYTLVDLRATFLNGVFDEEESSEMAFKAAAAMALRNGAEQAAPVLLEPVMRVEAVSPDDFSGAVIGDLSARGGQIEGMEARVSLPVGQSKNALIVPRDALITKFGMTVVFVVAESKAKMIPVKVIEYQGKSVGVESPALKAGMEVVIKGNERIMDDQPVMMNNKK